MKILLCLRFGIGDVIMELPALRALRQANPDAEIHLLGYRPALELFEHDPDFQALFCGQDFGFQHWGDSGSAEARRCFHNWLVKSEYHLLLDPYHAATGICETMLASGIPWRHAQGDLRNAVEQDQGAGVSAIWRAAREQWQLPPQLPSAPPKAHVHIDLGARQRAEARLKEAFPERRAEWSSAERSTGEWPAEEWSTNSEVLIGIAPVASSPLKRWPEQQWLELVQYLTRERDGRVLVFGLDARDQNFSAGLRDAGEPSRLALMERCHLQETAAMIGHCRAFVSNDTGLMHLAEAVDTSTIGIFGPTAAQIYGPPSAQLVCSTRDCEHRLLNAFGPPRCVLENTCLKQEASCIESVPLNSVVERLEALLTAQGFGLDPSSRKQSGEMQPPQEFTSAPRDTSLAPMSN